MIDKEKIVAIADKLLEGTEMYVVSCSCSVSNDVELLVDSDSKVSIDSCIDLSRAIEAEFDREVEDFSLTVASAGIGSELKLLRQFKRLVGSSVEVLLKSGIKFVATLMAADEQGIDVSYEKRESVVNESGKRKRVVVEHNERHEFSDIKSVSEYLDFK
ncbi:MAG: ribosome assembly cofactor RimP [Rikenellaceae bacterium]